MKNLVKSFCLVLALVCFAGMALGSSDSSPSDGAEEKDIVVNQDKSDENASSAAVTIEEQVLLDRDGVKITAKEYVEDVLWGEGIKVLIENNTDKNLGISCNALIVNNYMITDLFSSSVAAGKKANETIYLSSSGLEAAGIENIGQIEIYFHVYDSDSYDTVFDADVATINTSKFDEMDTVPADAGVELFNQSGIRIVGKVVDENTFWGTSVLLYLENTSGKNISVSCENMSINGFMVTPYFHSTIYNGKMAIDAITIMSTDLEENGIESIEDIELSFHIYNSDTYDTVADTDPISFSAK